MTDFPEFRFVTVHRPGPMMLGIRWAIRPTAWDMGDLRFLVFRSLSPTGPWDEVAETDVGRFSYFDMDVAGPGTDRDYYYLLRAVSISGKGYRDSVPTRLEGDPDHIAIELVRKKNLFLFHRGGNEVAALQRRTWGPTCTRCFNQERGTATDPSCPDCYGTGITGGFLNPVLVPCSMGLEQRHIVRAGFPYNPGLIYAEMANQPLMEPDDLIVHRRLNIRYRVKQVQITSHRMHPISQILGLLRCDDSSVLYELPVPESTGGPWARGFDTLRPTPGHHDLTIPPPSH